MVQSVKNHLDSTNPSNTSISIPGTPKVLTLFFGLFQKGPGFGGFNGVQPTKQAAARTAHAKLTAARDTDSVRRS